jgi:hypothetical protein
MTSLHPDIHNLVQLRPIEDLLLAVLRPALTNVSVQTLVFDDQTFPFVLIRTNGDWGSWGGDPRFIDTAQVNVQVYCEGLNADEDAAILSEAVRVTLIANVNRVFPGIGHMTKADMTQRPRRAADWASATGPVQYADLPTSVFRYETLYEISVKRAL